MSELTGVKSRASILAQLGRNDIKSKPNKQTVLVKQESALSVLYRSLGFNRHVVDEVLNREMLIYPIVSSFHIIIKPARRGLNFPPEHRNKWCSVYRMHRSALQLFNQETGLSIGYTGRWLQIPFSFWSNWDVNCAKECSYEVAFWPANSSYMRKN